MELGGEEGENHTGPTVAHATARSAAGFNYAAGWYGWQARPAPPGRCKTCPYRCHAAVRLAVTGAWPAALERLPSAL